MGVRLYRVVRRFARKKYLLSTGEGTFPQITGTYPQFWGLGDALLSKQLTQDMGSGNDISDSNTWNCEKWHTGCVASYPLADLTGFEACQVLISHPLTFLPNPASASTLPSSKAVFPRNTTF
jgi:hypothetical protein